ncbi:MAG: hypothetical protein MJZ24_03020, partial [Paludibacteraceae bacterium]|nr:hypothetical protein [Paludibacteraceae bacterium]
LTDYAKKTDLPKADSLLSKAEAENTYLKEHQSLTDYAKKTDLPKADSLLSKAEAENIYLKEHQSLTDYAKKTDLPKADSLLSKAEAENTYLKEHQSLTDYAKKTDLPKADSLLSKAEAENIYLKEHQSLTDYAKKTDLPKADSLLSKTEATEKYQAKGNYLTEHQSLAEYAKKSDVPSVEGLLTETKAAESYQPKGEYLTQHQSLADYAKKTDLPKEDSLLSKAEATEKYQAKGNYLTEHQSLAEYAKKNEIPSVEGLLTETKAAETYQPKGNYLTQHQSLTDYAKKTDLPKEDSLLSKAEAAENYQAKGNYLTEHQSLAEYAKKNEIPSVEGLLTETKAAETYQPKGEYLTEHQSLENYAKKTDKVSTFENDAKYVTETQLKDSLKVYADSIKELSSKIKVLEANNKTLNDRLDAIEALIAKLGGIEPVTTWSEDFTSFDLSRATNVSGSWYSFEKDNGSLKVNLNEPNGDNEVRWFSIAMEEGKVLDLSQSAYFSVNLKGYGDPVLAFRLVDNQGIKSKWININENGINVNCSDGSIKNGTAIYKTDISSYLGNNINKSKIVAIEGNMIGWDCKNIEYKSRNKSIWIDNLVIENSNGYPEGGLNNGYSRAANNTYNFSTSDFNDAKNIYDNVKTENGDRVIFIVRHSERNSASGKEAGLNDNGLNLLKNIAAPKMKDGKFANASTDAYYSSNVKRTVETSYFIGNMRGNTNCSSSTLLGNDWENVTAVNHSGDTESSITWIKQTPGPHTYFNDHFTGGTGWGTSQYYYRDHQQECANKCVTGINWLAEDSEGHPFTFVSSHDLCMVPYVCWATNNGYFFSSWNNDYDSNPSGWLNYMAGVAVIVHSDHTWEVYPVKCLDKGKFD